jgi:AAA+ superfamily predicted ATPase
MERFQGILICTTNRFEDLDQASLRRFNYKIGFRFLKPEGMATGNAVGDSGALFSVG